MEVPIDPREDPHMDPPNRVRIIIPFLPPTSNKIYVTDWRRRMRFKSREAKEFEQKFKDFVVPTYLPWLTQLDDPEKSPFLTYEVSVYFFFDKYDILTKGWGKKNGAKKPYKKMDAENRTKLLIDCVSKAIGIDDLHFFGNGERKFVAQYFNLKPQAHIFLTKVPPIQFGIEQEG